MDTACSSSFEEELDLRCLHALALLQRPLQVQLTRHKEHTYVYSNIAPKLLCVMVDIAVDNIHFAG